MADTDTAVILDLDGTLVDSVFFHVIAWSEALRSRGYDIPLWRIQAGIGMGGSRLVAWLLGRHPADLDDLKQAHTQAFRQWAPSLRPTRGAAELLKDLETRGVPYVIATSAGAETRSLLLQALGREDLPTTDADAVAQSKPAPDLLLVACEQLGLVPDRVTMVGDAPWDAEAARRLGMRALAVRCGGFGDACLRAAGAWDVVDDPLGLVGRL